MDGPDRKKRRVHCRVCPWRKDVDANDIPNGYCEVKHANLRSTIASGDAMSQLAENQGMRMMACHESPIGEEKPCVGWLDNQLGSGNNIPLRIAASAGRIDYDYELVGDQHATLEETLPK